MGERHEAQEAWRDSEYWDGHSFKDGCDRDPLWFYNRPAIKDLLAQKAKILWLKNFAFDEICDLLNSESLVVHKSLAKGDGFGAEKLPLGTIIRYSEERLNGNLISRFPSGEYENHAYYGLIGDIGVGNTSNRVIACFMAVTEWEPPELIKAELFGPRQIEVGKVRHLWGALSRIPTLDILKIGNGLPERSPIKAESVSNLVPVLVRSSA